MVVEQFYWPTVDQSELLFGFASYKKAINCFIKYTPFPLAYDFYFSLALSVVAFILLYTLIISGNNFVDFVNGFSLAVGITVLNYLFCCLQYMLLALF